MIARAQKIIDAQKGADDKDKIHCVPDDCHSPGKDIKVFVSPYEECHIHFAKQFTVSRALFYGLGSIMVAAGFYFLMLYGKGCAYPELLAAGFVLFFFVVTVLLWLAFGIYETRFRIDSTVLATAFAYGGLLAVIFSTQEFEDRFKLPGTISAEKAQGAMRIYALLLQAGFVVFTALR